MNIKLRALLEVLAMIVVSILGIGLIEIIAEKIGLSNMINLFGILFCVGFIYIAYKARVATLEIRKNLDKLDESIGKIKTKA